MQFSKFQNYIPPIIILVRNIAIIALKSDDQIEDFVMWYKFPEFYYFIQVFELWIKLHSYLHSSLDAGIVVTPQKQNYPSCW